MIALRGRLTRIRNSGEPHLEDGHGGRALFHVQRNAIPVAPARATRAWMVGDGPIPKGFGIYLLPASFRERSAEVPTEAACAVLGHEIAYLSDGDIVRINLARETLHVVYRQGGRSNTLLVTEQCNNYCLMCSQPPKKHDDRWLVEDAKEVVRMLPPSVSSLGISGGEPTLLGDDILELLALTKAHLPQTQVDMLSNGRRFSDIDFTRAYAALEHPHLTVGIPLYSDDPTRHDYIVQAVGAFDETVIGILNLKRLRQRVEVRVVLHAQSVPRLVELARFLARNLLFVDHVALMGLEMTGFTLANMDALWIDPYDYREILDETVHILVSAGMNVSVYNLPLCLVKNEATSVYRRSISDWKNEYLPVCGGCNKRNDCGGFFSSAVKTRVSAHVSPL